MANKEMIQNQDVKDKKAIEEKALNYFKTFIEDSNVISQYITDNDKKPSWDGDLFLYSRGIRDKKHFIGRVPVQVKGTEVNRFQIKKWKFKLEKEDLLAYLDEPTLFIVCQIKKNSKERKLFYRELLPNSVKKLLRDMGKNESRMTIFHPLTEDLHEFEDQLILFMEHSHKMQSFTDIETLSMNDLARKGIKEFSFITPPDIINTKELMRYLSTHYTYLYARDIASTTGLKIDIPISDGPMRFIFMKNLNADIKIGDKIFYKGCKCEIIEGSMVVTIDEGITLSIPFAKPGELLSTAKMTACATTLEQAIYQSNFLIAIHESGKLTIGEIDLHLSTKKTKGINELRSKLNYWSKLQNLLVKLHVTEKFKLTGISTEQGHTIDILIETICNGNSIKIPGQQNAIQIVELSNIRLLLWCYIQDDGNIRIGDFFDGSIKIMYETNQKEIIEISPYSYLQQGHLWEKIDNIYYEGIIPSAERISSKNAFGYEMANLDVLSMISASDVLADKSVNKSKRLLSEAEKLNQWLIDCDTHRI